MRYEFQLAIATISFLIVIFVGVLSIHLFIKPNNVSWNDYDPRFLFALKGDLNTFPQSSCAKNHTILFGSSPLSRAFIIEKSLGKWILQFSAHNNGYTYSLLIRRGGADLRFLLPIINRLPVCPKTLILHSDVFLTKKASNLGLDLIPDYVNTSLLYTQKITENLWPATLQIQTDSGTKKYFQQSKPCSIKCFRKIIKRKRQKYKGFFNGITLEHRNIIHRLINEGAQIIILDIGRSRSLETKIQNELHLFRKTLKNFSQQDPNIKYLSFESLDDDYYSDYRHLNDRGSKAFHKWFNPIYEQHLIGTL